MTTGTDYNITTKNAVINGDVLRTSSTLSINYGEKATPADKVDMKLSTALIPVSYTHLDVYKRQIIVWI